MLKLIKFNNDSYTLETLEDNVFITKYKYETPKSWKLRIVDDNGFNHIEYFDSLKSIQKTISKNMGLIF